MRLSAPSLAASAAMRGVEREPGATQKKLTPLRTSSSTMRVAQRRLARGAAGGVKPEHPGEVADLLLDLSPLVLGHGALDDPGPREQREPTSAHEAGPYPDGELGPVGPDPTDRTGVPPPIEGLDRPYLLERLPLRVPPTAGVGCNARSTSASVTPSRRIPRTLDTRCRLLASFISKTPASPSSSSQSGPSASPMPTRTWSCSALSFSLRSRSSRSSSSSASEAPRGLVPATASLRISRPSRR